MSNGSDKLRVDIRTHTQTDACNNNTQKPKLGFAKNEPQTLVVLNLLRYIKIYLHFVSFPIISMAQILEIYARRRQWPIYPTWSITMAADDLATQGARASSAVTLNEFAPNILISAPEVLTIFLTKSKLKSPQLVTTQFKPCILFDFNTLVYIVNLTITRSLTLKNWGQKSKFGAFGFHCVWTNESNHQSL